MATVDISEVIPIVDMYPSLVWLGKIKDWLHFTASDPTPDGQATTEIDVKWGELVIANAERPCPNPRLLEVLHKLHKEAEASMSIHGLSVLETASRILADGPKLFLPNDEQWESMEHVELRLPIGDFRSPYPALVVQIPNVSRARLGKQFNLPLEYLPRAVVIRTRVSANYPVTVVTMARFLPHIGSPDGREKQNIFSHCLQTKTIEEALQRKSSVSKKVPGINYDGEDQFMTLVSRSALNLCLMLSNYGHKEAGPVDPNAWEKHRRKKHLRHMACRDFTAVKMQQEITVRQTQMPPPQNPPGPGIGHAVAPHWRKGHWRAFPGQGAARAAGQQVPLLFVRPCLVRGDRLDGDVSESSVVYR